MADDARAKEQLVAVAAHFAAHRDELLQRWRDAADRDPALTTASSLSRAQFYDHIPEVLDAFEHRLRAHGRAERAAAAEEQREGAAGHGIQRWQQGYQQREAMREWRHLQLCLVDDLDAFGLAHPEIGTGAMSIARHALAELCSEGVCESADQYAQIQEAEAAGRVRDLERALADLGSVEARRMATWRDAAHDLRGSLGIVNNATAALDHEDGPERARAYLLATRGIALMQALLNDLIDLGRLEAGQERREAAPFDAAALLEELCLGTRPLAVERGLELATSGPATLPVEGDRVKTYRIAQNLLLNAVNYTQRGGVVVRWEPDQTDGAARWVLCVQDTGSGLRAGSAAPLANALKAATDEAQAVGEKTEATGESSADAEPASLLRSQSAPPAPHEAAGEGIGLAIVKRLCELLDASLELHTERGKGTTFRVIFPRKY